MPLKRLITLLLGLNETGYLISGLSDDLLNSIVCRSLKSSFGDVISDEGMAILQRALVKCSPSESAFYIPDKSTICRSLYDQLSAGIPSTEVSYDRFEIAFIQLVAALRESLAQVTEPQLTDLPCREFGSLNLDELSRMQAPDELFDHISNIVAHFRDRGIISASDAGFIIDLAEKMVSAPGYLRFLGEDKKREEMARLMDVAVIVRSEGAKADIALNDMIVILGLLLYNIKPSEKAASGLSSVRPSAVCMELQYHYNAILALNYMLTGKLDLASQHAALAVCSTGDPGSQAQAYVRILQGCIAIGQNNLDQAAGLLEKAGNSAPEGRIKALALFYRGLVFSEKMEYEKAIASFQEAASCVTDPVDRAIIHNNIGSCAARIGDLALAETSSAEMERLSSHLNGDTALQCRLAASSHFGALLRTRGEYAKAVERYQQALELAVRSGDTTAIANQIGSLGVAFARAGNDEKAFELLNTCMAYSERTGYWAGIKFAYWHIRHMLLEKGNHAEAGKFLETYVTRYPELKNLQ
jgi:tetratricopeptide (TPR) repeat protein